VCQKSARAKTSSALNVVIRSKIRCGPPQSQI
jgi:hypothetical protein